MSSKASARHEQASTDSAPSKNFLDEEIPRFSEKARDAAKRNQLRSQPLLDHIEKSHRINFGLSAIFRILAANLTRQCTFVPGSQDDLEPPLSDFTVSCLLDLGAVVSEIMVNDVEDLAEWADERGTIGAGESDRG
jgi:hypothetical protein